MTLGTVLDLQLDRIKRGLVQPYQPMTQAIRRQLVRQMPGLYVDGASHGTLTGYLKQRCRCLDCRGANAAHASKLRAEQRHRKQLERYQRELQFTRRAS